MGAEPGSFYADQFGSPDVRAGYESMGREIAEGMGGKVDVFMAAVGSIGVWESSVRYCTLEK